MNLEPTESPKATGHAPITADTRTIALSLVGLLLTIAAALVLVAGLVWYFASGDRSAPGPNATVDAQRRDVGPEVPSSAPALDAHLADELADLRARERRLLTHYAWIDREAGVARIPIQRAMQLLAQRASPSTSQQSNIGGNHD
jgi:hypothetical protein